MSSHTTPRKTRSGNSLADKTFKELQQDAEDEAMQEIQLHQAEEHVEVNSLNSEPESSSKAGVMDEILTEEQLDDASYVIRGKLTKNDIMSLWKAIPEKEQVCKGILYECILCGMQRRQVDGHGASNLKRHLNTCCTAKDTWEKRLRMGEFLQAKGRRQKTLTGFTIDPEAIFLRLVIEDQMPFSICQSPSIRRLCTGLKVPHRSSLVKTMFEVYLNCKEKLRIELQGINKFALMFDGWSRHTKHYVAIVICYPLLNKPYNERLLCFRTLPREVSMTSADHLELFSEVMQDYGLLLSNCVALVGDHASVNKKLAEKLKIPLVGCLSHRLNLGVKKVMKADKQLSKCLKKVHNFMLFLKTNKGAAHLEKEAQGKPGFKAVTENRTRWTSSFQMLERYVKQEEEGLVRKLTMARRGIVDKSEYKRAELSQTENLRVIDEARKMKDILHKATTLLQARGLSASRGKVIIDMVTTNYPALATFFENFDVPCPSFENALVKLQRNESDDLTKDEIHAVRRLVISKGSRAKAKKQKEAVSLSFEELVAQSEQALKLGSSADRYMDTNFIPATSVTVERIFSMAKHFYSDMRARLSKHNLEALVFMKFNHALYAANIKKGKSEQEQVDLELSRLIALPSPEKTKQFVAAVEESEAEEESDEEVEFNAPTATSVTVSEDEDDVSSSDERQTVIDSDHDSGLKDTGGPSDQQDLSDSSDDETEMEENQEIRSQGYDDISVSDMTDWQAEEEEKEMLDKYIALVKDHYQFSPLCLEDTMHWIDGRKIDLVGRSAQDRVKAWKRSLDAFVRSTKRLGKKPRGVKPAKKARGIFGRSRTESSCKELELGL